jgi:hypothetical protein
LSRLVAVALAFGDRAGAKLSNATDRFVEGLRDFQIQAGDAFIVYSECRAYADNSVFLGHDVFHTLGQVVGFLWLETVP